MRTSCPLPPSWPTPEPMIELLEANQQPRQAHARLATGQERDRLWQRWVETDPNLLANAGHRATTTPVVVLEPADAAA